MNVNNQTKADWPSDMEVETLLPPAFQYLACHPGLENIKALLAWGRFNLLQMMRAWRKIERALDDRLKAMEEIKAILNLPEYFADEVKKYQDREFGPHEIEQTRISSLTGGNLRPAPGVRNLFSTNSATTFNRCGWCKYAVAGDGSSVTTRHLGGRLTCGILQACGLPQSESPKYELSLRHLYFSSPPDVRERLAAYHPGLGEYALGVYDGNDPYRCFATPCFFKHSADYILNDVGARLSQQGKALLERKAFAADAIQWLNKEAKIALKRPCIAQHRPDDWFEEGEIAIYYDAESSRKDGQYFSGRHAQPFLRQWILVKISEIRPKDGYLHLVNDARRVLTWCRPDAPVLLKEWEYRFFCKDYKINPIKETYGRNWINAVQFAFPLIQVDDFCNSARETELDMALEAE